MNERIQPRRAEPVACVFTVRERPVGFRPSRWGGELVAIERGYFPVSPTGYLSLASHFGFRGKVPTSAIASEFLEKLADEQDLERRSLAKRLARGPQPGRNRLGNFLNASMDAEKALHDGFFAPDHERPALWGGAYRLACLIDGEPRLQPEPSDGAWDAAHCTRALEKTRAMRAFIERLAKGEFPDTYPVPRLIFSTHNYFELPPKPDGEKSFALPAVTRELALEAPPRVLEPETVRSKNPPVTRVVDEPATGTAAQMSLF